MVWKPIKYRWQWQLKSAPDELWPLVADTQRFNQAAALPSISYSELALQIGGSRRIGRTVKWGIVAEFEDFPFEWVKEQGFSNVRVFTEGPLAQTVARLTLEPNQLGTLLKYDVEVTPANFLGLIGIPFQFGLEMRRRFGQVFTQIDDYLQSRAEQPFGLVEKSLAKAQTERLANLVRQLAEQGHDRQQVQQLADLLRGAADLDLTRLRPYVLADAWQAPRQAVLEMFLSAAKLGLLNLRWDIMCPLCRGAKATAPSLDEVRKGVHCPTCNIDFEAEFTQNVELTFAPHPQVRPVDSQDYCIGGPMVTPHILVHQALEPGETRTVQILANPHGFRFRTQRQGTEQWLARPGEPAEKAEAIDEIMVEAHADAIQLTPHYAKQPAGTAFLTVHLTNRAAYAQRIFMERADWYTDAVTAARVTTMQHFRDLFSDEVLRPGEEIGVQGMTILFTDLVGSTAMYNRWGDAPSYALVREQFAFLQRVVRKHDGAIVKTIGDAVMAAFSDSSDGVAAALAVQKEVESFNLDHSDYPLTFKLGMHHGPCIAVNLNGRLDYFGTTVNLAARLEGQSQGGDVIISDQIAQDPAVAKLLETMPIDRERYVTSIKGFDDNFRLYRLTWRCGTD